MVEPKPSFITALRRYLPLAEKILLVGAALALGLKYLNLPGNEMLMICLSGLAGVFYLMAFTPPQAPVEADDSIVGTGEEKPSGFGNLLLTTIAPKVAGIGCAVGTIGILFALLHLNGSREMVLIGGSACASASIVIGFGLAQGSESAKALTPMLIRAGLLAAMNFYILTKLPA